jgi:hypothetical protein
MINNLQDVVHYRVQLEILTKAYYYYYRKEQNTTLILDTKVYIYKFDSWQSLTVVINVWRDPATSVKSAK